jgi:multidrug efflux pump subunit AcrA (membrane-fusion protein)
MIRKERTRHVALAVGALALAVAGTVGCSGADDPESPAGQASEDVGGMEGMEGMDMDGSIRLTSDEMMTFGVTFGTAEVRPLNRRIRTVGVVGFDETRMAYVAPRFGGWAERLHVDFTGQVVRQGQPLLEVYSPELVSAQEELLLAARLVESVGDSRVEDVAEGAEGLLESARRRLAYWDISDEQVRRLLETGEVRRTLTIHAPVSGIVMEKDVFQGQAFQPGRNLYMIADLSRVWVNAEIFESDAPLVLEGMPAEISVAALPGQPLSGTIEYVYPTLGDRTRSMRARIAIPNPGGRLKPGMYATVDLRSELGASLTVPTSAVLHSGERAVAFVDMGGGELMPRELRLGLRGERYVQVLEGLEPGQRVVTSAQFLLDSESNLAEVMKAMMAQMNLSDMEGMDMEGMDMDMGREGSREPTDMPEGMRMDGVAPDSGGVR